MDIPSEKHQPSPITGASSRNADAAPAVPSDARPSVPPAADEIELDDEHFELPAMSRPLSPLPLPTGSRKGPHKGGGMPPPEVQRDEARHPRKKPLERRTEGPFPKFKRLLRPETAIAAHAALDHTRAESAVSTEKVERDSMQFGKIREYHNPDYRPNRLARVLDGIYTHSPLRWLEFIDRGGVRFVLGGLFLLVIGGVVAWRFYGSLKQPESSSGPVAAIAGVSNQDRVARGRKAVEQFLAARTTEARLPLVQDPERAGPRMKQFYEVMNGEDPSVVSWEVGEPASGKHGSWLPFVFQDSTGRKVTVVMVETDAGCLVDWENFTAFGEVPWQEYCRTRPTVPKALRVRIRPTEQYGGVYNKESWQAYELEHRSGEPILLGYASRTGRTSQALSELMQPGQWRSAQVYLRFVADSGADNRVVIDSVVRSRWQDEATSWTGP